MGQPYMILPTGPRHRAPRSIAEASRETWESLITGVAVPCATRKMVS
jgi:hypothetical protein